MTNKTQAKQMSSLIKGPHWKLLMEYVAVEKERIVTQLLNCNEYEEVRSLQGEHKALSKLKSLHANLKQEERS